MTIKDYDNELLHMAHDLAVRLLPAFENTKTGIPYPRVGDGSVHRLPERKPVIRVSGGRSAAGTQKESCVFGSIWP